MPEWSNQRQAFREGDVVRMWIGKSLLLMIGLLVMPVACVRMSEDFNEEAWRKAVEATRTENLYAPHFTEGRFFNPWMPMKNKSFIDFLKWKFSADEDNPVTDNGYLPAVIPDAVGRIRALPEGDFILWVGHATFFMRLNGGYWITDPMFSQRALLPKRVTPPALTAADLKTLGIRRLNVLISHNHYDHLDRDSIAALPDDARFYVPLGLKEFILDLGKADVVEMDWWQASDAGGGSEVVCLPMQHWSRRIGQDVNTTLWASFMIITPSVTVYFAGDSGYFIGYREIGRLYPDIDYVLMPTTAYLPRWFMHYAHMDMDEAIDAFLDLKARFFIPTQWGTFHLGDEPPGYPVLDLRKRISARKLDGSRFLIPDIGEIIPLNEKDVELTTAHDN
jgi:N-acyl-phosphatidylethanolamine-hydrolysing phospholipase D